MINFQNGDLKLSKTYYTDNIVSTSSCDSLFHIFWNLVDDTFFLTYVRKLTKRKNVRVSSNCTLTLRFLVSRSRSYVQMHSVVSCALFDQ